MSRVLGRRCAAATLAAASLLATGACSGNDPAATPQPAPTAPALDATTASSDTGRAAEDSPGVPEPGSMDAPATTSGPLSQDSFPTPRRLGRGWRYSVDPGDAEEGYAGNGTPALARNPQEIVQTAVPFGCARRTTMPAPTHALEVDYRLRGATVIAVRARFADPSTARAFFTGRTTNLRACEGRSGSAAIGPLVRGLGQPAPHAVASDRTPASDPWREVSVLDGDTVVLVAAQGADVLTGAQTRRLVREFRR